MKKSKKSKKKINKIIYLVILLFLAFLASYEPEIYKSLETFVLGNKQDDTIEYVVPENGNLNVYFIDVGQEDSILISTGSKNMLIDAGNNEDGEKLVKYLKNLGIKKFDYVFGTHAHEDHIGGMDNIIDNFEIDNFYMPDVVTTTKTFEDVLDSLSRKNVKFKTPNIGDTFNMDDANFKILHVGKDKSDLNGTSIVIKLQYGKISFMFTGDATSEVESKITDENLKSTVLKVAHHGSKYSSTATFLNKVNPEYAVIMTGLGNSYGHPHSIVLQKLEKIGAKIYRTDESGTIIFKTNGENIEINTVKTDTNGA